MEPSTDEKSKDVFTVVERNGKTHWLKIGRSFMNRDSSWNVYLDALPTSGKLQLRESKPFEPAAPRPNDPLPFTPRREALP